MQRKKTVEIGFEKSKDTDVVLKFAHLVRVTVPTTGVGGLVTLKPKRRGMLDRLVEIKEKILPPNKLSYGKTFLVDRGPSLWLIMRDLTLVLVNEAAAFLYVTCDSTNPVTVSAT